MSILLPERPDAPGILDSDAAAADKPASAKLLREIARTGNWMRDAEAPILDASWTPDPDGAVVAPLDWRLLYVWAGCPTRPIHRLADVRLRAEQDGAPVQWRIRTAAGDLELEQAAGASVETLTGQVPLPGREYVNVELWVRAQSGETPSGIGTPTSFATGSSGRKGNRAFAFPVTTLTSVLGDGHHDIICTQGGVEVWRRRIDQVDIGSSETLVVFGSLISDAELSQARTAGGTLTFERRPLVQARSLSLRGARA